MEDNNFNKTELFENCYCQKVLPLTYDNSSKRKAQKY